MFNIKEHPHRRWDPLRGEWILVSPHRAKRPWQGQVDESSPETSPLYDPNCYLCPGNERAGGVRNPNYTSTFVFDNDFPALKPDPLHGSREEADLVLARSERGICRVVCFSPRHDLALPRMDQAEIVKVVDVWTQEYVDLGSRSWIKSVQIFENRGSLMGCSNPHPHCQIWANETWPNETEREHYRQQNYFDQKGECLLCSYLKIEEREQERIVVENPDFMVLVPFWAIWPFEALLISRRHITGLDQLTDQERQSLANVLQELTIRYDNLFKTSFPYSMGFHQRPTDGSEHRTWHLHAHFYPPLLRSATVRKFMVGYEMLGTPQRDITAEVAAERLRAQTKRHYQDG